jgi:NodT family efflux transporter outer membrane factor (OMF) lipoprotein
MTIRVAVTLALLTAAGLTACSMIPDYHRPSVAVPAGWREPDNAAVSAARTSQVSADWWKRYGSAELDHVIADVLAGNNDLKAALARINQARANLRIAGAALQPTVDASANAGRGYSDAGNRQAPVSSSYSAQLSVGYEIDLWRRNQAAVEAADARLTASAFDHDALALVATADAAKAYFQILDLRDRQTIARDNLTTEQDVLKVVEARFREGASSALEVSQQRTVQANARAALAALAQQQRAAENGLAVLRGLPPQGSRIDAAGLAGIALPAIAAAQPSSLLERRPDIRSAEAQLVAANADIGAARAAFFPQLKIAFDTTLTGFPGSTATSLAGSLLAPIFEGGRLRGELQLSKAKQAELVETYRKTVLTAFQEVEDALSAVRTSLQRRTALETAVEQARRAYLISRQRYEAGAIDFVTLLNTQSSQLQAEDSLAQAKLDQINASVDLYKALGGGWREPPRSDQADGRMGAR